MDPTLRSKLGNYWVFREGRREVHGPSFLREVLDVFQHALRPGVGADQIISALLLSGELESALADLGSPSVATVEAITDLLADLLVNRAAVLSKERIRELNLSHIAVPDHISISPPEGFVYYALHPSDFANLAKQVPEHTKPVAVIGIRTIGTTLSAVVAAANRQLSRHAERITVRPSGHPYDRVTEFTTEQLGWIKRQISRAAQFQVVDEGPGRSGSSFLSVAEALVEAGVDREQITLMGSRAVQLSDLCARNASERWAQFRFYSPITQVYERFKNDSYVGGGNWRSFFAGSSADWPACWPQMERLKFLSADRKRLFKFEGFGRFGEEVLQRANSLADAGFGPAVENAGDGMLSYSVVQGPRPIPNGSTPLVIPNGCGREQSALNHEISGDRPATPLFHHDLLQRIAHYCAFRGQAFRTHQTRKSQLREMVEFNLRSEFGDPLNFTPGLLDTENPVLVDGRMQPYEWILQENGTLLKVDGTTHGDDHFFPGPTDIAWDLAGTIVEWNLDQNATQFFLDSYLRASGDNARHRIAAFVLAYLTFRMAYCGMALTTVINTPEEARLQAAYHTYQQRLAERMKKPALPAVRFSESSALQTRISQSVGDD
jgi:hypothetical protein